MEARILAAFSVIIYNIAGVSALYFKLNDIALFGEWARFTEIVTFPVTFISYSYLSVRVEPVYPIVIVQAVMLCITLLIADTIVRYVQKRDNRNIRN